MGKDDIDDEHDLRTKEKYMKRMKYENSRTTCPCADCPFKDNCALQERCEKYRAWRKIYLKRNT